VKRWLAIALLVVGCGTSSPPQSPKPDPTPSRTEAPARPSTSAAAASGACQTSVRFLAAFADRFGGQLVGLRPLIVTTPFDSGATWTEISAMASTLRDYEGLEDKAAACPTTSAMSKIVATLRERAKASIDRSAAGSVNDNLVQRAAAADLYVLVPDVLALARSVKTAAASIGLDGQTALADTSPKPLGSLAPLATPQPDPTPPPEATPPSDGTRSVPSSYYAGYGAELSRHDVTSVSGGWTQPRGTCSGSGSTGFAAWVGIENDSNLEQLGTAVDCYSGTGPVYYAWYEMFPEPSVRIPMRASPGDEFSASVSRRGKSWTLAIRNRTNGEHFSIVKTRATSGFVALWIDEAPSSQVSEPGQHVLPLTRFGTVSMTDCSAVIDGKRRVIGDPGWSHYRFDMVTRSGTAKTVTSGLTGNGSAFRTTWRHS
jgi:Peptidase A4 family